MFTRLLPLRVSRLLARAIRKPLEYIILSNDVEHNTLISNAIHAWN